MTSDLIVAVRVQSSSVAEVGNVGSLLNMHSRHMKEADLHRKCSVLLSEGHCGPGVPFLPFALVTSVHRSTRANTHIPLCMCFLFHCTDAVQ